MKGEPPALLTVQSSSGLFNGQSFENRLSVCDFRSQEVEVPLPFANLITNSSANGDYIDNANYNHGQLANAFDSVNTCNSRQQLSSDENRKQSSPEINGKAESATNHGDESILEDSDILTTLRLSKSQVQVEPVSDAEINSESPTNDCATYQPLNGNTPTTVLPSDDSKTQKRRRTPKNARLMMKQQPNGRSSIPTVPINYNCTTVSQRSLQKAAIPPPECKDLSILAPLLISSKTPLSQCKTDVGTFKTYVNDRTRASEIMTSKDELCNGDNVCAGSGVDDSSALGVNRQPVFHDCVTVIREVYENGLAREYFAMQLDFALESGVGAIVIEPSRLGRETTQWLAIGTALRLSALLAGSSCFISGVLGRDTICLTCGAISTILSTLHIVSWRPDPCSHYRVERNSRRLQRLPLHDVTCSAPVVLVKCDNLALRNSVYDVTSMASLMMCVWRLYRWSSA